MQELLAYTLELLKLLGATLRSVAPVIGILLVFQLMVLWQPLENSRSDCSSGTRRSAPRGRGTWAGRRDRHAQSAMRFGRDPGRCSGCSRGNASTSPSPRRSDWTSATPSRRGALGRLAGRRPPPRRRRYLRRHSRARRPQRSVLRARPGRDLHRSDRRS
jgi:hypothetical protein